MCEQAGTLFLLVGPSGSGKSSILQTLLAEDSHVKFSISSTSRQPRPGELNGKEYHFLTRQQFDDAVDRGEFLEHAEYVGNCYGTESAQVEKHLKAGDDVIADIEILGARQIKEKMPECIQIFIMPPDAETLIERLENRGTESEGIIADRLNRAREEMAFVNDFDFVVVNDDLAEATALVRSIIKVHRTQPLHNAARINKVLRSFE